MTETQLHAIAIIPARGGSKGVPRKNIRPVAGRPLIAYTIEAARASQRLSYFVVTTDDAEIADVSRQWHCPVLMRPPELAADDTPMVPVVEHVLATLRPTHGEFDFVVLLQPTTPLRTADDIDKAVELLEESVADSVISVCQVEDHHPARMYRLVEGRLVPYDVEPPGSLRQALPPVYHRNGAIYACRYALIAEQHTLIGPDCRPYVMPRSRSLNIDDEFDLRIADCLLEAEQGP